MALCSPGLCGKDFLIDPTTRNCNVRPGISLRRLDRWRRQCRLFGSPCGAGENIKRRHHREINAARPWRQQRNDRHTLDGKSTKGIYPPKSNYALEIDKGPFEAWPVRCGITFAFGGLKIEAKTGNVQHVAGRPIPGLYAAGEMVGGLFVGGYGSGSGMMSGATFGRIAGTAAGLAALQS
jgi:hypothetical protein